MKLELKIGQKIKALRLASDLTQTELADRANLTKGFISQLENDQCSVSVESLADLLDALGVPLQDFFSDETQTDVVFGPRDRISIDNRGASRFELLVPGSTNNDMDPILLELAAGEKLEPFDPHPGEHFGFILKGTLTLMLGDKAHKVRPKHCFYFEADQSGQMMNTGNSSVKLLWITTPPQM